MTNEERRTLKAQLAQRAQLYGAMVFYLPEGTLRDLFPDEYTRGFLSEFRAELHRRAKRAEIASKAISLSAEGEKSC